MRGENKSHKIRLILGVLIGLSLVLIIFFSLYNRQNIKVSNKDKKTDVINETNNNQDNETLIEEVKEKDIKKGYFHRVFDAILRIFAPLC